MPTTSLLSLLMDDTTSVVGPPASSDPVGDKLLSLRNGPGSLASLEGFGNCSFPIENKLTIPRQEQPEPPPYSYSPDAYDIEIYGNASSSATRIEVDEPPLDASSPDTFPLATTPTIGNTRSSTRHPDWSGWYGSGRSQQHHRTPGVISPIDLAASPLTSSSIAVLEREYDRDTWRLFRRIQQARSLQLPKQSDQQSPQELEGASRLLLNQRMVSAEGLVGEEFEEEEQQHRARMATDEEEDELMFTMD